jgi:hypothetical protein
MASFIGAIITTVVAAGAAITVAWISHSAKISEFRQNWINGLRDDLATYFKQLEALHFCVGRLLNNSNAEKLDELEQKKQDTRNELLFAYRRILLRLNMKERLHQNLSEKLKGFWMVEQRVPDQAQVDEAIALSQAVLKGMGGNKETSNSPNSGADFLSRCCIEAAASKLDCPENRDHFERGGVAPCACPI